jgi:hypothetical protein
VIRVARLGRRGFLGACVFLPGRVVPYCGGEDLTLDAEGRWTGYPKDAHLSGWHTIDWPERVSGDAYPMWWDARRGIWSYSPTTPPHLEIQYDPAEMREGRVYVGPRNGGPD